MRHVAAFVALWAALTLGLTILDPDGSRSETSCARIVHNYLHSAAQAAGFNITHEHLIACKQDGDTAIARVEFDAKQTGFAAVHEVLAVRLVKAAWWPADAHLVG